MQSALVLEVLTQYEQYKHNFTEPLMNRVYFHNNVLVVIHEEDFTLLDQSISDFDMDWEKLKSDQEFSVMLDQVNLVRLNQKNYYYQLKFYLEATLEVIHGKLGVDFYN